VRASAGRDRGVRGSIASAPWVEHAHAHDRLMQAWGETRSLRSAEAVVGRRETSGPPVMLRGALDSAGRPSSESWVSEPGTREMRVHVVRLGGSRRLDASRVFSTGRSQDLLVKREGASREEVRSSV